VGGGGCPDSGGVLIATRANEMFVSVLSYVTHMTMSHT